MTMAAITESAAEPKRPGTSPGSEPMRVLVVDDDAATAAGLADAVRRLGHSALRADSGVAALEIIEREGADVVVSDWRMPGIDGVELCRRVRARTKEGRYVYFVLVSGHARHRDALAAMHEGVDEVLAKPLDLESFEATLAVANRVTAAQRRLARSNVVLRRQSQRALAAAMKDPLTGAFNRRQLDADLVAMCGTPASQHAVLAMIDVDHFKAYNDTFGHLAGDRALCEIVRVAQLSMRRGDALYRYGGEEFVAILHDTDCESAKVAMERLARAIGRLVVVPHHPSFGPVSVSIGLAAGPCATPQAWIAAADSALYSAKAAGRNRVEAHWQHRR
jgi:diguanylate cyclase (GGDEF)-like protein